MLAYISRNKERIMLRMYLMFATGRTPDGHPVLKVQVGGFGNKQSRITLEPLILEVGGDLLFLKQMVLPSDQREGVRRR